MHNALLTHYTKDIESLESILKYGFFYSYHPTRIFEKLFKDANIDAREPDDHAMICLTELLIDHSNEHKSKFGNYWVSVSLEWAEKIWAKKVEYVKHNDLRYNELLNRLKSSFPKMPFGYSANEQNMPMLEKHLRQELLGSPVSANFFWAKPDYKNVLNELLWIQIECHKNQIEWRIRNPNSFSGIQFRKPTEMDIKLNRVNKNPYNIDNKKDSIKQMVSILSKNIELRQMCFLEIPYEEIKYIIAPENDKNLVQKLIEQYNLTHVKIIN